MEASERVLMDLTVLFTPVVDTSVLVLTGLLATRLCLQDVLRSLVVMLMLILRRAERFREPGERHTNNCSKMSMRCDNATLC